MGVFLSGFIILNEGSDFLVGILNNSSAWALIIALFSPLIFERLEKRKKLLISLNIASRLMVCSIVFLPLVLHNNAFILTALTVMVIIGNILWSFYSIGYIVWMIDVAPQDSKNDYIYIRIFWLRISFTLFTIVMGFMLDWFHKGYTGFLIVFSTSLALSIADILIMANIKEPPHTFKKEERFNPGIFFEPFKNDDFRAFLVFAFFFYLSLTISSSYTPLYLIKYMKFDYGFITIINVMMYIILILSTRVWSRIEKKKGLKFVLKISAIFLVSEFLFYHFLRNETYFLLFFSPIAAGVGNSGFNVSILNYRYELMPESNRTVYEGWFGAVIGLSALIGPVIGEVLMKRLPVVHNLIYQYSNFQLLYLISFLLAAGVLFFTFFRPGKVGL